MIRTVTKKLIAAALLAFSLLFSFITYGCSFFDFSNSCGDVILNIKARRAAAEENFDFSDAFITVELRGEYSASKTQLLDPDTDTQIIFSEIPVGKIISVYAEVFKMIQNQNGESEKIIFYKGESESKEIQEGNNQFTIKLFKQELIVDDDSEEDSEQSSEPQTQDPQTSQETIEYIEIYISSSGQRYDADIYNEGDEEHPFKYVDDAVSKIIAEGDSDSYWKILISGETTGIPRATSGTGVNTTHGHIELPTELTTDNAKSIIITGATPHESWLTGSVPSDLDTINRGATSSTNSSLESNTSNGMIYGAALVIQTEVPVTVTNLKITGGYGGSGGAIRIAEGSTVSLGDGVLLTGNQATKGGAVFNQGNLFIYGTAVIGDKDSTSFANYDSSSVKNGTSANYASSGGGIYNGDTADSIATTTIIANLYLGYKPSDDGSPEVSEWTGGIYFNGASSGGGILNARKSFVYINSGTIKNNDVSENGGGIYNIAGRLEMSGGQIIHNRAHYNSSVVRGGGICNEYTECVFVMSGGVINENVAWARSGTNAKGGGVYNGGKMFMYGSAVIGDPEKNTPPSFTQGTTEAEDTGDYGNRANIGGGIHNDAGTSDNRGKLYMGYEPDESDMPVEKNLSGGVYYNYCKHGSSSGSSTWGGGGIYNYSSGNGEFLMSSGIIAYNSTGDDGGGIWMQNTTMAGANSGISIHDNTAAGKGNAIYVYSNQQYSLTLSGDIDIPAGDDDSHDIYLAGTGNNFSKIYIADDLIGNLDAIITPAAYDSEHQLITPAASFGGNLAAECKCFNLTPNPRAITNDGSETNTTIEMWIMGDEGKPVNAFDLEVMTNPNHDADFTPDLSSSSLVFTELNWYVDNVGENDSPVESINLTDSDNTFTLLGGSVSTDTHVIKLVATSSENEDYEFFFDYIIE